MMVTFAFFALAFVSSLIALKWKIILWKKDFGGEILKVIQTKRSILKRSFQVGVVAGGLILMLGLLDRIRSFIRRIFHRE